MNKSRQKITSFFLVVIQFSCLAVLFFTAPARANSDLLVLLEGFSVGLGLWGIVAMRRSRLNVFPDVLPGATLVNRGPYKFIRHPMYTSLILLSVSLLLSYFSFFRLIVVVLLTINLLYKIEFEEKLLMQDITGYADYAIKTWKIIPYVY